jgi:hypothetical protein
MAVLLSAFWVGWSSFLPEPIIEPTEIVKLVRDLDNDDFRLRDRATKRLRAIGVPALDFLDRACETQCSVDFSERADRLIRQIRLQSIAGGPSIRGIQLALLTDRRVFGADESIALQLEIRNVSCAPRFDCEALRWGYTQTHGPGAYVVRSHAPHNGLLELHQLSGRRADTKRLGGGWNIFFNPNENRAIPIGGKVVELIEVGDRIGRLTPGEYEVHFNFSWYAKDGIDLKKPGFDLQRHEIISNTVRFSVEKR